jgi:HAD superfamily hydrolase (TIGR01450 family)
MIVSDAPFMEWWKDNSMGFEAFLFDIDGTLISGKHPLPGAEEMLCWLRNNNFPFFLLTNDGNHSLQEKSAILAKAGLHVEPQEIASCSSALKGYALENDIIGEKVFVMGDLGQPDYAVEAGLPVTRDVREIDECKCVIVGEGVYDWRENINAAINTFIKNPDKIMLVPNPDSYWPNGSNGEIGIGAGGKARFIKSILNEMGRDVNIKYLGKPYGAIFEYTFKLLEKSFNLSGKLSCEKIMMFGDNLQSDILGANMIGCASALMMTGVTSLEQAENAKGDLKPDYVFSSF